MRKLAIVSVPFLILALVISAVGCGGEAKDSDGDGWTDAQEQSAGTDPYSTDTDGDGYWDPQDPNPLDSNISAAGGTPTATATVTPTPLPTPTRTPEPTIPPDFTTYTDEASFFSISYPTDWKPFPSWHEELGLTSKEFFKFYDAQDASWVGLFFLVFYAESPREPGGTLSNVNIVVQPLSEGEWMLDEIVETRLRRTEEISQEYREFSRLNTTIDGREAIIVDWEESIPDLGKSRSLQMFMLKDKLVWKVTCYAGSEVFSDFEDDLYAIVRSLRISK